METHPNTPSLDDIGRRCGTDKSSAFHDYLTFYQEILPARDRAIKILEMGVAGGNSLATWAEYWTSAQVFGIDDNGFWVPPENSRIRVAKGNQENYKFLKDVVSPWGPFDVIIDDAGHHTAHQRTAFCALLPDLVPGGIYIIEDLHATYLPQFSGGTNDRITNWLYDVIDERVNERGKGMCGRQPPLPGPGGGLDWIDTITFRRSVAVIRKRK